MILQIVYDFKIMKLIIFQYLNVIHSPFISIVYLMNTTFLRLQITIKITIMILNQLPTFNIIIALNNFNNSQ